MRSDVPHPMPASAEGQLAAVLWLAWDPVGGGTDEYTAYVPDLLNSLQAGIDLDGLASELSRLRSEQMEMPPRPEIDRHAASRILDWHYHFVEDPDRPSFTPTGGWD
jgi:hypothetical protein